MMATIDYTQNAIQRTPLDPRLHFVLGKLYIFRWVYIKLNFL